MTISKTGNPIAPSTNGRPAPVRVKLQRINASFAKAHPPDGQGKVWWARLQKALGTSSSAFVNASLLQLQQAACLRGGSISEIGVNSALALIEAAEPRNEIEGALALQMACTHIASMAILGSFAGGCTTERRIGLFSSAAARLMRTYAAQVEAFSMACSRASPASTIARTMWLRGLPRRPMEPVRPCFCKTAR